MSLLSRLAVQAARAYGILSSRSNNISADYLVVAGGGGGGNSPSFANTSSSGGGAGGMLTSTTSLSILNTYSIVVGAGGNGAGSAVQASGSNGSISSISGTGLSTISATGGGGGAYPSVVGNNGGSGGGGGEGLSGGTGISGQGYAGGTGADYAGAGGGGAGAVGGSSSNGAGSNGGAGGAGASSSISGSSVTYAGGGGGGTYNGTAGAGGSGGGGAGGKFSVSSGTSGTANLGGGGGGGTANDTGYSGGNGGSGIVIISYASATPKFVGGTITTSGGKQIHTFTSSGTLSPITPITASYLVVAGGGSGGSETSNGAAGGGGGAGGLLTGSTTLYSGASYVVTVGAGAASGASGRNNGLQGSNSVLSGTGLTTLTSTGGGYGGCYGNAGGSGGSGGGGGSETAAAGGAGTSGQGNNGGAGVSSGGAGGGGGAGATGANATTSSSGAGGVGVSSSISGTATYYAGGGGGGYDDAGGTQPAGAGGNGGGGAGGGDNANGISGTPNTGGGGGGKGQGATAGVGGQGGSGIVIISYAGSQAFNGGLVTTSGGNTIHTFTSTGALTPLTNNLNNSLRFRSGASAYLSRTPSVSSSRTTWTWSGWVKRGRLTTGSIQGLFAGNDASSNTIVTGFRFTSTDALELISFSGGAYTGQIVTTQVFRDPSAWYHLVAVYDTTQATAANRTRIYVNGQQVTAFSTATYPSQNYNGFVNTTGLHVNGAALYSGVIEHFDGYLADVNFIDGQALEPYYFGNNDANGVWKPIQYKGTYGTNGFYLTFGNTTSTTTLGYDSSPNGNNWTCNNISLTAGTTYDAMLDVPTNTSATVANYCTWNPLKKPNTGSYSNGNLTVVGGTDTEAFGTMAYPSTGSFYFEYLVASTGGGGFGPQVGICTLDGNYTVKYFRNGYKGVNGTNTAYGGAWALNDIIGIAYNASTNTVTFYKNNVSQGDITASSGQEYFPYFFDNSSSTHNFTFGQRPFTYTPPTGYVALNTYNLPTPTILQGNKYMDATLYTGNGGTQVIVNQAQFKPDFVWYKQRNTTRDNGLEDSVRGTSKIIISNSTAAEVTASGITGFNSNGFSIGNNVIGNESGGTYVGWQWQAGQGSTSSNTNGSITSTVSVNTTAGFSVVTYTGTGANATVGHGLGVAPKMIITKQRNAVRSWGVYHVSLGAGNAVYLDLTQASAATTNWNSTTPTSSVFSVGTGNEANASGGTMVAYCWAEIAGFSKFTSYTGNGSTDGPFVYCGFRPKFVMVKEYTQAGDYWMILDTSRDTYNIASAQLYPNASSAESATGTMDILSNGFKLRYTGGYGNNSGQSYIVAAWAENPFKNSNAR